MDAGQAADHGSVDALLMDLIASVAVGIPLRTPRTLRTMVLWKMKCYMRHTEPARMKRTTDLRTEMIIECYLSILY